MPNVILSTSVEKYKPKFKKGDVIRNGRSMYAIINISDVEFQFGSAPFYQVIVLEDPWAPIGATGSINVYETDFRYHFNICVNYNKLWNALNGQI